MMLGIYHARPYVLSSTYRVKASPELLVSGDYSSLGFKITS